MIIDVAATKSLLHCYICCSKPISHENTRTDSKKKLQYSWNRFAVYIKSSLLTLKFKSELLEKRRLEIRYSGRIQLRMCFKTNSTRFASQMKPDGALLKTQRKRKKNTDLVSVFRCSFSVTKKVKNLFSLHSKGHDSCEHSCCPNTEGKTEVAEEAAEGTTIIQVATLTRNSFFFYSKVIKVFAICLNRIVLVK